MPEIGEVILGARRLARASIK